MTGLTFDLRLVTRSLRRRPVAARLAERFPDENGEVGLRLTPLREHETAELRPHVALLAGGAAMLLAIGCANVAGFLLVHAAARERDLVVRAALGAARGRLVMLHDLRLAFRQLRRRPGFAALVIATLAGQRW